MIHKIEIKFDMAFGHIDIILLVGGQNTVLSNLFDLTFSQISQSVNWSFNVYEVKISQF